MSRRNADLSNPSGLESTSRTSCGQKMISEDRSKGMESSSSLKSTSDKCVYDSRLSDSGVWSGSNIHSQEITPDSPFSKSCDFDFSRPTDMGKVSSEQNPSYTRLDSGIDVSQQFSELNLNDLNKPSKTSSSSTNTNNQGAEGSLQTTEINLPLLEMCFQQDEDGETRLHAAISRNFIEEVFALVRMVPDPAYLNIKNNDRQTALHLAVMMRQPRLVRLLVCSGAALDVLDHDGNTPLHLAASYNDLRAVQAICEPVTVPEVQTAQLQYSPFQFHETNDIANVYNYEGLTCAHMAAQTGNINILRTLLWFGADINAREWKGGETCLHMAVERKDLSMCQFLLSCAGLDADREDYARRTAYQLAWPWDPQSTAALKNHGVDTYVPSSDESDDDEMPEMDSDFNSFQINGSGLVNVGA